jgi:hypothetical protein
MPCATRIDLFFPASRYDGTRAFRARLRVGARQEGLRTLQIVVPHARDAASRFDGRDGARPLQTAGTGPGR